MPVRLSHIVPLLAVLLCSCLVAAAPLLAQPVAVHGPTRVVPDAPANAFLSWPGHQPLDGVLVELPASWTVRYAVAIGANRKPVSLTVTRERGGRWDVRAASTLEGPQRIVVHFVAARTTGQTRVRLEPFAADGPTGRIPLGRVAHVLRVDAEEDASTNRAFYLDASADGPALVRHDALPPLGARHAFTAEFWLRTTGLDEVVLSTWDGDERTPYPMEFVVNETGHLVFYRGEPGRHQALVSSAPLADGMWHHVALTNDPETGWTRLVTDGLPTDSLYTPAAPNDLNRRPLALGNRTADAPGFSGVLDDLRLWSRARSLSALRNTMRRTLPAGTPGLFHLDFDQWPLPAAVSRWPQGAERAPAAPPYSAPVQRLAVNVSPGAVFLLWEASASQSGEFAVEKSTDGQRFELVGDALRAEDGTLTSGSRLRFAFTDPSPTTNVTYYRVAHRLPGGDARTSDVVKVAVPDETQPTLVFSNHPNPFSTTTAITYELAEQQAVSLAIWDVNGQRLSQLADGVQSPGLHTATFDGSDLPSGIYFVRLTTTQGTRTRKIILAR